MFKFIKEGLKAPQLTGAAQPLNYFYPVAKRQHPVYFRPEVDQIVQETKTRQQRHIFPAFLKATFDKDLPFNTVHMWLRVQCEEHNPEIIARKKAQTEAGVAHGSARTLSERLRENTFIPSFPVAVVWFVLTTLIVGMVKLLWNENFTAPSSTGRSEPGKEVASRPVVQQPRAVRARGELVSVVPDETRSG